MSQEKDSKQPSFRNSVKLVGFLKETTLNERTSQTGKHFITGNVTVAIDEFNTHRVRFTVFQEDSPDKYEKLSKFLPSNTVSIASYLKATPTANFATASSMAAKVWVMAGFEEYAARKGEVEKSSTLLRGYTIGNSDPEKTFVPSATFEVDTYIDTVEDEVVDEKATGRLLIGGIIPAYKDLVYRIPLVAPTEDNVAKYIKANYKAGDTARLSGDLVAMRVQLEDSSDEEKEPEFFGKKAEQQYTTRFVREYVITSGPRNPIAQGEKGSITTDAVKKGLAVRENLMVENGKQKSKDSDDGSAAATANVSDPQPAPAPKAAANPDDFDF